MNDDALPARTVQRLHGARLTYSEVGATRSEPLPSGYGVLKRSQAVGAGRGRFEAAVETLMTWEMHRRAGLRVQPSSQQVATGAVAVLRIGPGPCAISAPVRVTYVVDEPSRKGYAYGTLPGHPESGEEAFVLELHTDGSVTFTITVFSRPQTLLARVGGPVSRAVQSRITDRYLNAV